MLEKIIDLLGTENVLTQKEDILPYGFDGTAALKCLPEAVVFPGSTAEVVEVVRAAREAGVGLVSRGSGTGLSGGSVPSKNSWVLCLPRMNGILEVDTKNLTLLAEAGVITADINKRLQQEGLFYPPDPSSQKISTIGGNVANNSGGLRGLKYGVTRNYVMGLEVVLANGEVIWLGNKCVKDVAGYSLKDLFVGSEGTLGIITKVLLRLVPAPAARKTLTATFDRLEGAAGGGQRNFWRWLSVKTIFMSPRLLHGVGRGLRLYQTTGPDRLVRRLGLLKLAPKGLAALEPTTPTVQAQFSTRLIDHWEYPPGGTPKYKVGMLTGCVQDLVFSHVNRDTVDVLLENQCAVFTPRNQSCCGSLHAHNGELDLARTLARRQLDAFDLDRLDAVITNAGGCGAHLKAYGHLLADDPQYAERAHQWDEKCKDIHEWLVEIDFRPPDPGPASRLSLTYHDSCHLCHGQKVVKQPREVLRRIPGIDLVELPESSWCCGSAGIYNITQPEQATKLRIRKMENIARTGCATVATANPGCHLQIENGFKLTGAEGTVHHPVSLLAKAYRAENK